MPLETATYISDLVVTNPASSDGMNGADDHMRLTKATIKNTFPNVTGAVTATHTELNGAVDATKNGVAVFADAGAFFKTSGDGFKNSLAGDIDVWIGGQIGATFQRTGDTNFFKMTGSVQITGPIEGSTLKGAGMCPIGAVVIWPSDTLPPTSEGVFAWCNGATYSKTTYATCYARVGGSVDANNFAVPNYQEVTLVGKSGMGGATAPGLLTSVSSTLKAVLGALFGSDTVALTIAQLASHYHSAGIYDPTHTHGYQGSAVNLSGAANSQSFGTVSSQTTSPAATGVRVNSPNGLDTTYSTGSGEAHNNVQPSRATNFIIRLA